MTAAQRPLVVLLHRPDAVPTVARRLRDEGWTVQDGWDLPAEPWDLAPARRLCSGTVTALDEAPAALAALRRTAGIIVSVDLTGPEQTAVLADLHRLGDVRTEAAAASTAALPISPEQRELLSLVADGASVPEAAAQLFLSARTAERRLATTRKALGVRTTAEAIGLLLAARRDGQG